VSTRQSYSVWKKIVTTFSPEGGPLASRESVVDNAENAPFAVALHLRSPAGLFARANGPDADQTALLARICTDHGPFDATVSVGPVLELTPAVKSAGVGFVSEVVVELICAHTNEVAVNDTLAEMVQRLGDPDAVQPCATAAAGAAQKTISKARPLFIWTGAPL
jgi:hypothetical protein